MLNNTHTKILSLVTLCFLASGSVQAEPPCSFYNLDDYSNTKQVNTAWNNYIASQGQNLASSNALKSEFSTQYCTLNNFPKKFKGRIGSPSYLHCNMNNTPVPYLAAANNLAKITMTACIPKKIKIIKMIKMTEIVKPSTKRPFEIISLPDRVKNQASPLTSKPSNN